MTGDPFNIAVAFEPRDGAGAAMAQSTFHQFADDNRNRAAAGRALSTSRLATVCCGRRTLWTARNAALNIVAWLAARR